MFAGSAWTSPLCGSVGRNGQTGDAAPTREYIRDVLLAQQPNKRFATVEELGALTLFLISDAAASITGVALSMDGGWTAH